MADVGAASALSKSSIVDWVNAAIDPCPGFSCIKPIPATVVAAFANEIFGDAAFPLRGVDFFPDGDAAVARRNCDAVLEGLQLLGFQPTFSGASWADGVKDYGGVLLMWRWLRQKALERPLTRRFAAADVGLAALADSSAAAAIAAAPPSRVVRPSDVMASCGIENSAPLAATPGPFMCGGPNGEVAKQLFDANLRELVAMRRVHDEIVRAVADGSLDRVVSALQRAHGGM
jgi:hypothetical protein